MKRYLSFAMFVCAMFTTLISCDKNEDPSVAPTDKTKATEMIVYSGGHKLTSALTAGTRAVTYKPGTDPGYNIPDNGAYHVHYFIRIDNNIPGEDEINLTAGEYYPRTTANKTRSVDDNHGLILANANWQTGKSFSKYIWSPDGSAIQSIIIEEPTIEALILADQGKNKDGSVSNFEGLLKHQDELHFLWYACKKQDSDKAWHIDGILTRKDRTNISETAYGEEITKNYQGKGMVESYGDVSRQAHVEIDIHQQEHKDWNEIKTSIHLRDTVAVEVFLPIDYQALADDFDIRVGEDYKYVTENLNTEIKIGEQTFSIEANIKHEEQGIRITIAEPSKEALRAARTLYGDGITFEIHSYVTSGLTQEVIWSKLKQSTCKVEPYTFLFGQITSAFYKDDEKRF